MPASKRASEEERRDRAYYTSDDHVSRARLLRRPHNALTTSCDDLVFARLGERGKSIGVWGKEARVSGCGRPLVDA